MIQELISSAGSTGCSLNLAVVAPKAVDTLREALSRLRCFDRRVHDHLSAETGLFRVPSMPILIPRTTRRRTRMSTLKAEALAREFHYNGVRIPDPGPELTVEQVRDLLTPNYPEIATASVSGPEASGSVLRYTFSRAIGSKG